MTSWLQDQARLAELHEAAAEAELKLAKAVSVLHLIAMPKRPDGSYNRSREACEELASKVLKEICPL